MMGKAKMRGCGCCAARHLLWAAPAAASPNPPCAHPAPHRTPPPAPAPRWPRYLDADRLCGGVDQAYAFRAALAKVRAA